MFKNSVDIMLFKEDPTQVDPQQEAKRLAIEMLEKQKSDERKEVANAVELQKTLTDAVEGAAIDVNLPSAAEIRNRTLDAIKKNASLTVTKEASEILAKALQAIENAVINEKFSVDLGGPGRPEPGQVILKQAYGAYLEDARKTVHKKLEEQGYKVHEFENIFIRISW